MEVPGGGPVRGGAVASQTEGGLGAAVSRVERRSKDGSDFRVLLTKLDEYFPLPRWLPNPGLWHVAVVSGRKPEPWRLVTQIDLNN